MRLRTRCLIDSRRFREAHRALCAYTSTHPDDVEAWVELGLVCREIGDLRRIKQAGHRLTLLDRHRFEGYFLLGCSFLEEHDYDKAITFFQKAARIAPERSETWLALGMSYENAGSLVQAFRAYAKADNDHGRELMTQVAEDLD
jgi:Flp pilus assembly protein TadD